VSPSLQILLLVALPYAAVVVFIAGLIWRYRQRFTISSLSSQFLESRWLVWGSVPFHLGVAVLFAGHLLPLIIPSVWLSWMSNRSALLFVETAGSAAAILCLLGLVMLFIRRLASRAVLRNSTAVDLLVLAVLITQVTLGLAVAMMHRWGAVWSARTTTPYLWSLITFQPDPSLVAGVPTLMTLHLTGAWIVLALIPFTRLVHMFAVPLHYLHRPPQRVIWLRG
jgi:nitrate reductase gamma subunit